MKTSGLRKKEKKTKRQRTILISVEIIRYRELSLKVRMVLRELFGKIKMEI